MRRRKSEEVDLLVGRLRRRKSEDGWTYCEEEQGGGRVRKRKSEEGDLL